MRITRVFKSIFTAPLIGLAALRKTRLDNFVGGLIFGAIFSLVVNIATVRIQEVINKQRVYEALEREIIFHLIDANGMYSANKALDGKFNSDYVYVDNIMTKRLSTRIWDSAEASRYLFELDQEASSKVEVYYGVTVDSTNRYLQKNYEDFMEAYKGCNDIFDINLMEGTRKSKEYCNTLARQAAQLQVMTFGSIVNAADEAHKSFHPTKDRLSNYWLKLLLGNQALEVLR